MAQKSYALLVAILVTITLLDCFTECGAAKQKRKGKGKDKQKEKGKFREDSSDVLLKCVFAEEVNFVCGSDGNVYANAENLECGKLLNKDVKEAEPSACTTFPKTDEEKNKLEGMWMDTIKEFYAMKAGTSTGAPATARKDKNKGSKTNRNDKNKKDKDDKKKKRKGRTYPTFYRL